MNVDANAMQSASSSRPNEGDNAIGCLCYHADNTCYITHTDGETERENKEKCVCV